MRGIPDPGSHEAVYLPDGARPGVERAADRPRDAWPSCKVGLACGRPAQREEVEDGFGAGDRWEQVVDYMVGARP